MIRTDVAVVGAGPAGLTAAIRVRFVKTFQALSLHATLIDPGQPGGLLRFGGERMLSGPGLRLPAAEVLERLLADQRRLEIPLIKDQVTRLSQQDDRFLLNLETGGQVQAEAVILATGSRPLVDEDRFSNVLITYKGTSYLRSILREAAERAGDQPVVVATNRRAALLAELYGDLLPEGIFLVPEGDRSRLSGFLSGRIIEAGTWRTAESPDGRLELHLPAGECLEAGAMLLDYLSFQARPLLPPVLPQPETKGGTYRLTSELETSLPGLFLAGDVSCRYASLATALGDGVTAGFGAYRHVYRRRFGAEPPLFAYQAPERPQDHLERELPVPTYDLRLRWLETPPPDHPLLGEERRPADHLPSDILDRTLAEGLASLVPLEDDDEE
ncbi:MAG: FAD-dependent oxidoreductase [Deltaproteobacteria bacterium]|nr:FAD-dependent oxidoreductase [Deltaproteobacteria bacterium]